MEHGDTLVIPSAVPLAGRLRLARIAAGLSRGVIAERLGISSRTYARMEDGSGREPRRGELIAIAQITGQDLAFFGASFEDEAPILPHPLPVVNGDNS